MQPPESEDGSNDLKWESGPSSWFDHLAAPEGGSALPRSLAGVSGAKGKPPPARPDREAADSAEREVADILRKLSLDRGDIEGTEPEVQGTEKPDGGSNSPRGIFGDDNEKEPLPAKSPRSSARKRTSRKPSGRVGAALEKASTGRTGPAQSAGAAFSPKRVLSRLGRVLLILGQFCLWLISSILPFLWATGVIYLLLHIRRAELLCKYYPEYPFPFSAIGWFYNTLFSLVYYAFYYAIGALFWTVKFLWSLPLTGYPNLNILLSLGATVALVAAFCGIILAVLLALFGVLTAGEFKPVTNGLGVILVLPAFLGWAATLLGWVFSLS